MPSQLKYSKAPITEAIIALDAKLPEKPTAEALKSVWEQVKDDYPDRHTIQQVMSQIAVGEGIRQSAEQRDIGQTATNAAKTYNFQARINGFSCHRLAPYESWEPFRTEARRLWDIYRETAKPQRITRVAVRYINRIDIPGDRVELDHYFRTVPNISPDLPQGVAGYFMQLTIPCPNIRGVILINEAIIDSGKPSVSSVVLDIDLFRTEDIGQTESDIWSLLEQLHVEKNNVFEACITEAYRELIR